MNLLSPSPNFSPVKYSQKSYITPIIRIKMSSKAFSIVEVLVCVAIVVVLGALLFPMMQKNLIRAKQSQCASNQRQIFHYWALYAADNNGLILPSYYSEKNSASEVITAFQWFNILDNTYLSASPQLPSSRAITIRQCPSNPGRITYWGTSNFAYNNILGVVDAQKGTSERMHLGSISQPSKFAILTDSAVQRIQTETITTPRYRTWYYFVSTIQGSGYTLNSGALSADGNSFTSGYVNYQWHNGQANFLFADGHVEALSKPEVQQRIDDQSMILR